MTRPAAGANSCVHAGVVSGATRIDRGSILSNSAGPSTTLEASCVWTLMRILLTNDDGSDSPAKIRITVHYLLARAAGFFFAAFSTDFVP